MMIRDPSPEGLGTALRIRVQMLLRKLEEWRHDDYGSKPRAGRDTTDPRSSVQPGPLDGSYPTCLRRRSQRIGIQSMMDGGHSCKFLDKDTIILVIMHMNGRGAPSD